MQYAILRYNDERITCAWSKEHDDAVMAKLVAVTDKYAKKGKLGAVAADDSGDDLAPGS